MIRQYIFFKRTQKIGCFVIQEENKSWICQVQVSCGCASLWFPQVWYKHLFLPKTFVLPDMEQFICSTSYIKLISKIFLLMREWIKHSVWSSNLLCFTLLLQRGIIKCCVLKWRVCLLRRPESFNFGEANVTSKVTCRSAPLFAM